MSTARIADSIQNIPSNILKKVGIAMGEVNTSHKIVGAFLALSGVIIEDTSNFVGDAVDVIKGIKGEFVDGVKYIASSTTNAVVDGAKKVWDWISFWD